MAASGRTDPPPPAAEMLAAVRRHVTIRYARGVDALFWELEKRPMRDTEAVRAVLAAAGAGAGAESEAEAGEGAGRPAEALDLGAALVIVQALRLDLDLLEADVFDAALSGGMSAESVAAVLELPGAGAARARHEMLRAKRDVPRAVVQPDAGPSATEQNREAGRRAGLRARGARERAAEAGRRREQLASGRATPDQPPEPATAAEHAAQATANSGEQVIKAREAAERVALGLLRAADLLELCAARGQDWSGQDRETHRRRAAQYLRDAASYREMASRYRDQDPGPPVTRAGR